MVRVCSKADGGTPLIRSAARYSESGLSGDKALLAAARADAHAAHQLDASGVPDAAVFSPKFRAFYAASP